MADSPTNALVETIDRERREMALEIKKIVTKAEDESRGLSDDEDKKYQEFRDKILAGDKRKERLLEMERLQPSVEVLENEGEKRHEMERRSYSPNNEDPDKPLTSAEQNLAMAGWMCRKYDYPRKAIDLLCLERMCGPSKLLQDEWAMKLCRGGDEHGMFHRPPRTPKEVEKQHEARMSLPVLDRRMLPEQRVENMLAKYEKRATNVIGTPTLGGNLVPDEMIRPLENALLFFGGMLQVAERHQSTHGGDWPVPTSNDTNQKGAILGEDQQEVVQEIIYNQVVMKAFKYTSKMVHVSVELLQDSATNLVVDIGSKLGERVGRILNEHFTTGAGTTEPRGITLDSVSAGALAAADTYTFDELITLKHSVDIAYRNMNARWMMHDNTLEKIAKIKDTQNRPLWLPNYIEGQPDRILGHEYVINNDMPTTGLSAKNLLFGALQKYLVREVRDWQLMRLDERYAEFYRVAFLGYSRFDGRLIDAGTNPVKHLANPAT